MAKGGRIGGNGKAPSRVIWVFIAACIAVAIWGDALHNPAGLLTTLRDKSQSFEQTVHGWVGRVGLTTDGSTPNVSNLPGPVVPPAHG